MDYQWLLDKETAYFAYLEAGGNRPSIAKERSGDDPTGWVFASNLGYCPLKNSLRAQEAPPKFSQYTLAEDRYLQRRLRMGEMVGRYWQEVLVWAGGQAEVRAVDEARRIRGYADIVLDLPGGLTVVEVKSTEANRLDDEMRLAYAYQTMHYARALGASHFCILTSHLGAVNVWSFLISGPDGFEVSNQNGFYWNGPRVTWEMLDREIQRQHDYQRAPHKLPPPVVDPVTDPNGYQCIRWVSKPRSNAKNGSGEFRPRCEYSCHFAADEAAQVAVVDGVWTASYPVPF